MRLVNREPKFFSRGFALVELMIALVLGLVIIGAVTGVMLSNNQSYRMTRSLSQIQDSTRVGFELIARDIRQAGGVPCGNDVDIINVLNDAQGSNTPWQFDWGNAVRGLQGNETLDSVNNRIAGTEALILLSGESSGLFVKSYSDANNAANLDIGWPDSFSGHGINGGDILLICNEQRATIFQASGINAGGNLVVNTGNNQSPGNCTKGLGPIIPGNNVNQPCNTNGNRFDDAENATIAKLGSRAWYIGDNGRPGEGGRSLFMASLTGVPGSGSNVSAEIFSVEIASGVTDMRLRYRLENTSDFITAAAVGNQWARVNAVEVTLDFASTDSNVSSDFSVDEGRLKREFSGIVALRNRAL